MSESKESYSSKKQKNTRVKVKQRKKTVGITLPKNLVERARKRNLTISFSEYEEAIVCKNQAR
jgi:post-segregation antitoxin (ccd killing protein)